MPLRNLFHEGEAEAKAALLPGFFVRAAVKLFEDLARFIGRDPATFIRHTESDVAVPIRHINPHYGSRRTVFNCIRHQIRQRLIQKQAIRPNLHSIHITRLHGDLFCAGDGRDDSRHIPQHRPDFEIGLRNLLPSRLDIRDIQKRLDLLVQPVALIDDRVQEVFPFFLNQVVFDQHLAIATDRGQGRTQFVRD